jgi:hypothetical protein
MPCPAKILGTALPINSGRPPARLFFSSCYHPRDSIAIFAGGFIWIASAVIFSLPLLQR